LAHYKPNKAPTLSRRRILVTIKNIAEHLGVAASTVARALADNPRISEATRHQVHQAAEQLGYVAHSAARQMRSQRSKLVGLVIPDVLNAFYSTAAHAISQSFDEAGFQMLLCICEDKPDVEWRQIRTLAEARVAGIVWVPTHAPKNQTLELLRHTPHVQLIRRHTRLASDWFGIDDVATTLQATQHLLELGHRRIAYIGGPRESSTGANRLKGFLQALQQANIDPASASIHCDATDVQGGRKALDKILQQDPRPSAIVTATSLGTEGVLDGLKARAVQVPGDMSIVGFNDSPALAWWGSGLTTMRLPVREIAIACSAFLIRKINQGKDAGEPPVPQSAYYAPALIQRGSTQAFAPSTPTPSA
jgi:LacI family transcriptional regulator